MVVTSTASHWRAHYVECSCDLDNVDLIIHHVNLYVVDLYIANFYPHPMSRESGSIVAYLLNTQHESKDPLFGFDDNFGVIYERVHYIPIDPITTAHSISHNGGHIQRERSRLRKRFHYYES